MTEFYGEKIIKLLRDDSFFFLGKRILKFRSAPGCSVSVTIRKIIVRDKGSPVQAHSRDRSFGIQLLFVLVVEFCAREQVPEAQKFLLLIIFLNDQYMFFLHLELYLFSAALFVQIEALILLWAWFGYSTLGIFF